MPLPSFEWFSKKAVERLDKKREGARKAEASARSAKGRSRRR